LFWPALARGIYHVYLDVNASSGCCKPWVEFVFTVWARDFVLQISDLPSCASPTKKGIPKMVVPQNKYRLLFIGISMAFLLGLFAFDEPRAADWGRVKWVDDGDTVLLADGRRIRYIGINAPEIAHAEYDRKAEPLATEALNANRRLVYRKHVRLEWDKEKRDRYGRWLAYVFLPDGRFVNRILLEAGLAYVLPHYPNTAHARGFLSVQRKAMSARRGIWRQAHLKEAITYWGNARSRRFHRIACPFAKKIRPDHRVVFSTQWEAFWAGYAPAKGCVAPAGGR
jgi:micrococcal nuclease